MNTTPKSKWYVLRASSKQLKVAQALNAKGFEVFLPMQRRRRQWADRVKILTVPLFNSLVFCRFELKDRIAVLSTPGVSPERERGGIPLEIPGGEIARLRRIAELAYPSEECDNPGVGDPVEVKDAPEIKGYLVECGPMCRVVVPCDPIGRAISITVPMESLRRLAAA